ncbi:MAG: hypothetical protein PVJ57_17820, partial [Phycisphaerae bacterium]
MHSILKARMVRWLGFGRGHGVAVLLALSGWLVGVPLLWTGLFGPLSSIPTEAQASALMPSPPDCEPPDGYALFPDLPPFCPPACDGGTYDPGDPIGGTLKYCENASCCATKFCPTYPPGLERIPICLGSFASFEATGADTDDCTPPSDQQIAVVDAIDYWLRANDSNGVLAPITPPCLCNHNPESMVYFLRQCYQVVSTGEFEIFLTIDDAGYCGLDADDGWLDLTLQCEVPCPEISVGLSKDIMCPGESITAAVTFTYPDGPSWDCPCVTGVKVEWWAETEGGRRLNEETEIKFLPVDPNVPDDFCTRRILATGGFAGKVWICAQVGECEEDRAPLTIGCESCGAGGCAPGAIQAEVASLDVAFPLGHGTDGMSAGRLWIHAEEPDSMLATPAALHYNIEDDLRDDITVTRDSGSGVLQTISAPEVFVTIVSPVGQSYQIEFDPVGSVAPKVTWEIAEGPTSTDLTITKTIGQEVVETYTYYGTQGTRNWTLTREEGTATLVQTEAVAWTAETGGLMREYTIADASSNEIYRVEEFYPDALDNEVWTARTVDPSGAALVTTRTFYTTGNYEGYLESQVNPDGSWEWYVYGEQGGGHTVTVYRPWLDETPPGSAPSGTPSDKCTSITQYDTMGHVTLREEYADGVLVSKAEYTYSYDAYGWLTQRTESRHGDGNYCLDTVTTYDDEEPEKERPKLVEHPDGTITHYDYTPAALTGWPSNPTYTTNPSGPYPCTWVTRCRSLDGDSPVGEPNLSTGEITITDVNGRTLLRDSLVYAGGGWAVIGRTTYEYDELGRVEYVHRLDPYDNSALGSTYTEWDDCCGGRHVTDETGVTTHYEYDILGRPTEVWKENLKGTGYATPDDVYTVYTYGFANGYRFARTAVQDLEQSPTVRTASERKYDLAGRLLSDKTLDLNLNLVYETTYSYQTAGGGGRLVTVTRPDLATEITEYYRDGRSKSVSGTGTVSRAQHYAALAGGVQQTWTLTGTANPLVYESWLRRGITSYDMLGRTVEEVRPAYPSDELTTEYTYYGDSGTGAGQLQQVVTKYDGDAVQAPTVYEYDVMGNLARSGLDVDGGGLDEDDSESTDRITETQTTYQNTGGVGWWRITKTWVYDDDVESSDLPHTMPLSKRSERLTGFSTGEIRETKHYDAHNDVTSSLTVVGGTPLAVTETVDSPESSEDAVRVTVNGLLVSSTTPTGVTFTYEYDGIGRQTAVIDGRENTTTTHYNDAGQVDWVEDEDGNRTTYTYYADDEQGAGQVYSVQNAALNKTYYAYTPRGEVYHVWGDVPQPVEYGYDGFGQRVTMTTYRGAAAWDGSTWPAASSDDTTEWTYDPATGLLTEKEYADDEAVTYTYTTDGKLKSRTWARGVVTGYGYTLAGDMAGIDYNCADPDDPDFDIAFDHDRRGRVVEVTDAGDGTDHALDYSGWPDCVTETISGGPFSRSFAITRESATYMSQLSGLYVGTSPIEYAAVYGYDSAGRLNCVTGPGLPTAGSPYGAWYTYHSGSDLVHETQFKDSGAILAKTVHTYEDDRDLVDSVENIWNVGTPVTISKYAYTNNELGLRETIDHTGVAFGSPDPAISQSLTYNPRNELESSARSDNTDLDRAYTYDPIGNRIDLDEGTTPVTTEYTANEVNQYEQMYRVGTGAPSVQKSSYDEDGNLVQAYLVGDVSGDGLFNGFDIAPFIYAATHEQVDFESTYPDGCYLCGDITGDGSVNNFDINPFTSLQSSGSTAVAYEWDAENRLVAVTPVAPTTGNQKVLFKYDYLGRRIEKAVYDWDSGGSAW